MDLRLHANPQQQYALNGGASQNSRPGVDDLQFLSQEEQECIQFFEDTIDLLEESLKEEDWKSGQAKAPARGRYLDRIDGSLALSHSPEVSASSLLARPPSPKDQDIIDLVRPEPDLVQTKQPIFRPTNPDFQRLVPTPENHFEIKPRRDPVDSLPSESYGATDSHSYHPPGCIPTPVLIAHKIAENQAGGTTNYLTSVLHRRESLEPEKPPSCSTDLSVKHGPPTSAKPTRFPANISVIHGNKEHQNQSAANVNIHERRAQMLANLTGTSHPLVQEAPQQTIEQTARKIPTRSISFKDPTPEISRMEALSKLGLNRNRAMSGEMHRFPISTTLDPLTGVQASAKPLEASVPPAAETNTKLPQANVTKPSQSQNLVDRKPEIMRTSSLKGHEDRNPQTSHSPPAVTKSNYSSLPLENKAPISPASEVTLLEFNSYGGKSIMVHPSTVSKSEHATPPTSPEPNIVPPAALNPSEFNTYGGKTKIMTPAAGISTRDNLPDILSSHIDKNQTSPEKLEPLPTEQNSYGGKSRTINPSPGLSRSSDGPVRSFKAPAPTPAPKPHRHTINVAPQKAAPRASSPEHRRRSSSMFRPQGITVQFSGRGPMNESRREALRKLGLLKDS